MRTVSYKLLELLADAKRKSFVVPSFQREFVWNQSQIKLLVDSIARNYPIGSLLLLHEPDPRDPFLSSRQIDADLQETEKTSENFQYHFTNESTQDGSGPLAVYYVLDGQQRLTSLVRVFLQASTEHSFYFDLKGMMDLDAVERPSSGWVIRRDRQKKLGPRYLRSDAVTDAERCQVLVEEYFESNDDELRGDRPAQRRSSARVNKIFETIRNYQVPVVILDRGESMESICRIFETINSTGTRLTTFDLAVARFFPSPDLHSLWEKSLVDYPILLEFRAEGERVLQVIALLVGLDNRSNFEATRSTLLSLHRDQISSKWDRAVRALAQAYQWAEERGSVPNFPANEALMVPLAFFMSLVTNDWKRTNPGYVSILERWYFCNALQQGARQASNYRVAQSASQLKSWLQDGSVPSVPTVFLSVESMMRLAKSDNRYRAILCILRWKGSKDIWTDETLCSNDVEDHHIFPAALARRDNVTRRLLDSVANKLLISTATNRSLGDRMPSDYLAKMLRDAKASGTLQAKMDSLSSACIPVMATTEETILQFDQSKVSDFLKRRAALILEQLGRILGDSLSSDDKLDDNDDM